jgi:lipoate-protein ligase A
VGELIHEDNLKKNPIPIIKRFSGGGTVVVDEETIFITFICQKSLHPFAPYPEPIMKWTEKIYQNAFPELDFRLRENDYAIGEKKCGGNAQYLSKERWLHHTTFLWNFKPENMDLLLHPKKTPKYREGRTHLDFLTRLSEHMDSKEQFVNRFKESFGKQFPFQEITVEELLPVLEQSHRQSTQILLGTGYQDI